MDHSSGHGGMKEDALNVHNMSVWWGGKQATMHHTIVPEVGIYDYNDKMKLASGDIQHMVFTNKHDGPFYMDHTERKQINIPTTTGKMGNGRGCIGRRPES